MCEAESVRHSVPVAAGLGMVRLNTGNFLAHSWIDELSNHPESMRAMDETRILVRNSIMVLLLV